ncbi:MAG: hypothetical protein ABIG30_01330 [Candidatus Aenigmatarchaeota archaeon]
MRIYDIAAILLNVAVLLLVIVEVIGYWAFAVSLLLLLLIILITRIEFKTHLRKQTLQRKEMVDILDNRLGKIGDGVDGLHGEFERSINSMYDKLHTSVDMQRRVWTHDFEVKHKELAMRVGVIEEKVNKMKRLVLNE